MWDYIVAKTPLNLPKLDDKTENVTDLEVLLEPVREIVLPSDNDSDVSSGIVDGFEELNRDSFLRPIPGTKLRFLSKPEADRRTVDRFTDDFKSVLREMRCTLKLDDLMTAESDENVEDVLNSAEKHVFVKSVEKATKDDPIDVEPETAESEVTSDSAVWNMIRAHRGPYFYASPPHYDIYNVDPDHYLKRPHVTWDMVDVSKKKCEKWLQQCE